jgi:hypothetical protein
LNESSKTTINELRAKIEQMQTDNYNLAKAKEKVDYDMTNQVYYIDSRKLKCED